MSTSALTFVGSPNGSPRFCGNLTKFPYYTTKKAAKFDEKLRSTNGEWGIRDVNALSALADEVGLRLKRKVGMPANNLTLCFVRK